MPRTRTPVARRLLSEVRRLRDLATAPPDNGRYATDPGGYARGVLKSNPTPQQDDIFGRLLDPPYRVLVPSANNVGKTHALGCLINWHHDNHDPGIVLCTSVSFRNVRTQVFKEVRRLRPRGRGLKPRAPEIFHTPRHFVLGFSARNPDAFQGHHEGSLLLVFDEATGIPAEFWDRAETMFQSLPGHGWVSTYNPNDPTTPPYAAEQGGGWHVVRLSALDHPNVTAELEGRPPPIPSAVRLHRVLDRLHKECEDCGQTRPEGMAVEFPARAGEKPRWWKPVKPEFAPQVLGRWPEQSATAVWSERDWERATAGVPPVQPTWPVQIGADPNRFGSNRFGVAVRHGTHVIHLEARTAANWPTRRVSFHMAERLRELCHQYGPPAGMKPKDVPVLVDDSGGYGSGIVDYSEGYRFVGVSAAETAREPEKYPNRKSELWFVTRLAADEGAFFLAVGEGRHLLPELKAEMTAVRYSPDKRNRRVVEGKDAVKDRLGRSPDIMDAVNLSFYPVA